MVAGDVADRLHRPVTRLDLARLHAAGVVDDATFARLTARATASPDSAAWARFLRLLLLVVGATLLLAGVVFFFAWNWADLHRFAKLGLVAGGISAGVVAGLGLGLDRLTGQISLSASALLVGVLFAVFGQIYQTGADAWQLFALWSALIVPWVVGGRFGPLLLGWVLLVAVSYGLFLDQVLEHTSDEREMLRAAPLVLWFGGAAAAWRVAGRTTAWLSGGLAPRLLGALALSGLTGEAFPIAVGEPTVLSAVATLGLAAVVGTGVTLRERGRLDVGTTAGIAVAGLVWLDVLIGWLLFDQMHADVLGFLLMVAVLIAEVALTARWLLAGERREATHQDPADGDPTPGEVGP